MTAMKLERQRKKSERHTRSTTALYRSFAHGCYPGSEQCSLSLVSRKINLVFHDSHLCFVKHFGKHREGQQPLCYAVSGGEGRFIPKMSITSVRVGKRVKAVDSSVVRKLDKLSFSEMSRKAEHFDTNVDNHEFGSGKP
jgi:hypothetical protein